MLKHLFLHVDPSGKKLRNTREHHEAVHCAVVGARIPPELVGGTYYKNGPGVFKSREPMDGSGVIMSVTMTSAAHAVFRSRAVDVGASQEERWGAFGSPPLVRPRALQHLCQIANASNTSVVPLPAQDDLLVSLFDGGAPRLIHAETLETVAGGQAALGLSDGLPLRMPTRGLDAALRSGGLLGDTLCAHPHPVPGNPSLLAFFGCKYSLSRSGGLATEVTFYELGLDTAAAFQKTASLKVQGLLYAHDFIVTADAYIIFQHKLELDWPQLFFGGTGIVGALRSCPRERGNVHVVPRSGSSAVSIEACLAPGFVYHHCKAVCQPDGTVIIASLHYPRYFALQDRPGETSLPSCRLVNTTISPDLACHQQEMTASVAWEFPCASARGQAEFFCVAASTSGQQQPFHKLVRVNCLTGATEEEWDARPTGVGDDGIITFLGEPSLDHTGRYVLCTLHRNRRLAAIEEGSMGSGNKDHQRSRLLVFDAHRIAQGPTCQIVLPDPMPMGLHGCWHAKKMAEVAEI